MIRYHWGSWSCKQGAGLFGKWAQSFSNTKPKICCQVEAPASNQDVFPAVDCRGSKLRFSCLCGEETRTNPIPNKHFWWFRSRFDFGDSLCFASQTSSSVAILNTELSLKIWFDPFQVSQNYGACFRPAAALWATVKNSCAYMLRPYSNIVWSHWHVFHFVEPAVFQRVKAEKYEYNWMQSCPSANPK